MLCLQQSLLNYTGDDEYSLARMQVLVALCSKPTQVEYWTGNIYKYKCTYNWLVLVYFVILLSC